MSITFTEAQDWSELAETIVAEDQAMQMSLFLSTPASSFLWEKLKVCKLLPHVGVDAVIIPSLWTISNV